MQKFHLFKRKYKRDVPLRGYYTNHNQAQQKVIKFVQKKNTNIVDNPRKKKSKPNRFGRLSWYPQTQDKSPIFFPWLCSVEALVGVGCVATAKVEEDWESQLVFSRKFKEGVQVSKGVKVHWIPYMALHIYGSSVTKWLSCCWVLSIYFGSNKSSNNIRIWYLVKNLSLIYLLRIWKKKNLVFLRFWNLVEICQFDLL